VAVALNAREKELAAQAAGTCVASPSGPKNPQAESRWLTDRISHLNIVNVKR
jgi:hypothetical protein